MGGGSGHSLSGPGCGGVERWDNSCRERTQLRPPAVLPSGPGEAELLGPGPSRLAGCLVCPGLALAPHYLVSWLESWASLTGWCTSTSVLSLVPERSLSAPICSRTTERCSAVHFQTKGFRWLKGNTITDKGPAKGCGVWVPSLAHTDLQLCIHVSGRSGLQIWSRAD